LAAVIPTPQEACDAIVAALNGVYGLSDSQVLNHDPYGGQLNTPLAVTCATGGISPTDVTVTVRCYASTTNQAAETAWEQLNALVAAVEDRLAATNTPRSTWERPLILEVDSIILSTNVAVARTDF